MITAAAVLGIGLSGFFDGILLHQVLQWHHLLSLVPGETFRSIEAQILADGLFHVLMYLVTATGLYLLWRVRRHFAEGVGWRTVIGGALVGFGLWNVIDVGFFHWTLGIHRIRVDVPDPMTYDLAWLAILGGVPLAIGWLLLRKEGTSDGVGAGGSAVTLALLALLAAPLASLPPPNSRTAIVLFASGGTPVRAFEAALAANSPVVWMSADGRMMAVRTGGAGSAAELYRTGATLVTRSPAVAGCVAALRT
ncbi:DUF2243 domain-containing protein [uncultured Sphingomonas sp.]|uniref:DUF2243 domain-containing protein n=1 Tax=uncultured Sphingomonas sp. TaxID=158754 RepID=UPI0025E093B6|nr:DUF2243 domain-containing protein [uncultured Sphingomonas sp.]